MGRRKEGGKEEGRNPKKNCRDPHLAGGETCSNYAATIWPFLVYNVFSFHVSAVYEGHKKFQ